MGTESIHVLHVDDEPEFAEMTAAYLEREDERFEVDTATSAPEGLDRLDETDYDCIVSDYDMPRIDGIEFLEQVRADHSDLPFILFTGKGSEEVASEAIHAGVTDYLQKENGSSQYTVLANRITNAVEQFRVKRRARRQRRQHRELFDQAPLMYVVTRDEGGQLRVEDCNDRFVEKLGYDREAVVGSPLSDFYADESRRKMHEEGGYERALSGEFASEERTLVTEDGETIETINRASPRLDDRGEPIGAQSLFLDITERKERERELELYETMIETVPDGVYALDEDFRYVAVNQALADLTGHSREQLIGSHLSLVHDEDVIEEAERDRERLVADGIDDTIVVARRPYRTADGGTVPTEVRFRALPPDDDGSFRGTSGVVRDISEREERERELELYETIVEASGDAVYALDADGHLTFVNDAFCELIGYAEEELIGEYVSIVMDDEDIERSEAIIRELLDGEEDHRTLEMDLIRADGDRVVCETHIALLPAEDGFAGTTGIHRDVTERKRRERELERQNDRLAEFASVVSHDLRNPLNVAEGNLELAREECESEHLDGVAAALDRMDALIEDILTLAREGESVEETEPVRLADVVEACWGTVDTADATLAVETDATIRADRSRLQQLLENLVRNSVEHGGERVTVTVGVLDDGTGFYVADDGPGIAPEAREQVFEYGHSTAHDGTGFGLTIVREVARAHGWEVTLAESDEGGARFEIGGVESDP